MKEMREKNIWYEVFGLGRCGLSVFDSTEMIRFRDGAGTSHIFLKF